MIGLLCFITLIYFLTNIKNLDESRAWNIADSKASVMRDSDICDIFKNKMWVIN